MAVDAYAYPGPYRLISDKEQGIVSDIMADFSQLQMWRNTTANQWEEISELILPTSRNTFYYGNYNWPGVKKTDRQIDATGASALRTFAAICDSLLTPRNQFWHGLAADDEYVMKDRQTKLWFETVSRILFKERYTPDANFSSQNQQNYTSLGAFGTASMYIDVLDTRPTGGVPGLRYRALPLGETFFRENHQGIIDYMIRWFRLTPRQVEQKSELLYNFLHAIRPREDGSYDPERLDARGKPWMSHYVSMEGRCLMQDEGGYRMFPVAATRFDQTPGEMYGRSPAMLVLPALKTLNAQKRTFLKQGHRAADPVLLLADDGIVNLNLRPGATNAGMMTQDGKPLVGVLPTGEIQISKEMMQEEKSIILDAFYVSLFQILTETPTMTATEVIERANEKGILLAPTMGRQQSEYLGPTIHREIDLLSYLRKLPPMPPRLREAKGSYQVVYTSPLARAARAQEAAGFMRTVETAKEITSITQDPSYLDPFDFDTAIPAIAEIQSVPPSWMASDDQIAVKRKNRAQQQAAQAQVQAMPAQAAMMKARAAMVQSGANTQPQGQRGVAA